MRNWSLRQSIMVLYWVALATSVVGVIWWVRLWIAFVPLLVTLVLPGILLVWVGLAAFRTSKATVALLATLAALAISAFFASLGVNGESEPVYGQPVSSVYSESSPPLPVTLPIEISWAAWHAMPWVLGILVMALATHVWRLRRRQGASGTP